VYLDIFKQSCGTFVSGSEPGTSLEPLELIMQRQMLHKLMNMMDNTAHHTTQHRDETTDCVQSEASSAPLQQRTEQEVIVASSKSHAQWLPIKNKNCIVYCIVTF